LTNRVLCFLVFLGLSITTASAQSILKRLNINVGGGMGIGLNDVDAFVGRSYHGEAGIGKTLSRRFSVNAEYMYYDLPFKNSVIQRQFLKPGAGGNVQSGTLNGIVKAPLFFGRWGAYGIFGVGWYERSVSNRKEPLVEGQICQPAWRWWDLTCVPSNTGSNTLIPNSPPYPPQAITSNSKGAGGFNAGGGVTRPFKRLHAKWYIEARYHRAYQSDGQTRFIPLTIGLRW
jgi:hypothetical protein